MMAFDISIHHWHPMFVHYTVALITFSAGTLILSALLGENFLKINLFNVAKWNLWGSALLTVGTIVSGLVAYDSIEHDMPSHIAMIDHRNWAFLTFLLIEVVAIWSLIHHVKIKGKNTLLFIGVLLCSLSVGITAYKGGHLVYSFGLGVKSLPYTQEQIMLKNTNNKRENIFKIDGS